MALHIFSKHYLIFYGHCEPLMIVFYPISLPNKKITLTVCVFLSPLVFLSQETWHWAISTQDDLFFLCLVPLPPSKQLRLSKASTVDRVVVPFRLASRTERPVQNQFLGPSKHENISSLNVQILKLCDRQEYCHSSLEEVDGDDDGTRTVAASWIWRTWEIIDKQGRRAKPLGDYHPTRCSKMMRCTPFPLPCFLKKGI